MRHMLLVITGLISLGIISFFLLTNQPTEQAIEAAASKQPLTLKVELEKQFMDGRVEVEVEERTIASMEDFWTEYEAWQMMEQTEGYIRFRKEVNDISPYLKANGYFGLKNGQLTIFEGIPLHEAAVQSFYQINTQELEANLYQQLEKGIKINSKEDYLETLEAFRVYYSVNHS